MPVQTHPTADTLAAFNSGSLPDSARAAVEEHIANCDSCCAALGSLSDDRIVGLARLAAKELPATAMMLDLPEVPPELVDHPRYQVLTRLGFGGMGIVYKAEQRAMGRIVAIKIVARRYTSNPEAVERFRREVRAAGKLNHPNIVTAHDADEANGLHFLVMEYVEGISLDQLVQKKGPLAVATACQCIRQAAQGLQHAFEKGMVHRDIKPHNLMVTRKGQIKVLDFGLARLIADAEPPPLPGAKESHLGTVTSPSLVMGTPDYLAPEQARNSHDVDIRADIYALGCVFYFLLTGRPPYSGLQNALDKMLAHVQDDPEPIRKIRPEVPVDVADILTRMLAKNREDRFATPAEVATALKPFTRAEAIVDDQPEIVDAQTDPEVEVSTAPIGAVDTDDAPSRPRRRRKGQKRRMPNRRWVLFAIGAAAIVLLGTIGLIIAYGWKNPDGGGPDNSGGGPITIGGSPAGKRVLFVVPSQGLYYPDYGPTKDRLTAAGVVVETAATRSGDCYLVTPPGGPPVTPMHLVKNVNVSEYAAVLFCGQNPGEYIGGPKSASFADAQRIVNDARRGDKIIGAICAGQAVPGYFGGLGNARIAASEQLRSKYGELKGVTLDWDHKVVTDGRIITAASSEDAIKFADEVLAALAK
jgi:eukaryotic-like serine/threonine-protein kinase